MVLFCPSWSAYEVTNHNFISYENFLNIKFFANYVSYKI